MELVDTLVETFRIMSGLRSKKSMTRRLRGDSSSAGGRPWNEACESADMLEAASGTREILLKATMDNLRKAGDHLSDDSWLFTDNPPPKSFRLQRSDGSSHWRVDKP
uniref:Uncharacterized protein n=1 Tax=Rhodosorus marinus TaxID=101924 RepID=A0A7S3A105_9RHOD|mmetsp:Transcript_40624/g.161093  ORF Transcript_40624/g.161093 Transcript_40624/m.161093 type:complete len:107 (+) Transcript_40624:389-709(+)